MHVLNYTHTLNDHSRMHIGPYAYSHTVNDNCQNNVNTLVASMYIQSHMYMSACTVKLCNIGLSNNRYKYIVKYSTLI